MFKQVLPIRSQWNVWRPVMRICMTMMGLKGLKTCFLLPLFLHQVHFLSPNPTGYHTPAPSPPGGPPKSEWTETTNWLTGLETGMYMTYCTASHDEWDSAVFRSHVHATIPKCFHRFSAFNKHQRPMKSVCKSAQRSRLLFSLNWSN